MALPVKSDGATPLLKMLVQRCTFLNFFHSHLHVFHCTITCLHMQKASGIRNRVTPQLKKGAGSKVYFFSLFPSFFFST